MELGLIPDNPGEYVDLFGGSLSSEQKRAQFLSIENTPYLTSCDRCSGEQGTDDPSKRFPAAEQVRR
jgi:cytochrome c553